MNFLKLRYRLRKTLAERGLLGTLATLLRKRWRRAPAFAEPPKVYAAMHPFDEQYGVETSGLLFPEDLASGKQKDLFNAGYFGVAPSVLRQILERLALDYERFTFVDLGSGKGRALLIASEYPFRAIVGVELSAALHGIAESNILRYRGPAMRCLDVRAIEADATEYTFPSGPVLVYLWNPFSAPVFARVLANLEASLTNDLRDTYIVYIQPDLEGLLEAGVRWRRLWRDAFPLSEEDYTAHAFPSRAEVCSVYVPADLRR